MIAKIVQGRGFRGVINYVLGKERAQLLQAEGIRLKDREAIIRSFITQSKLNPKITKPVAHISLDFSAQDKGRLTDAFMVKVAQEYLQKMGYSNTQYLIARHHDTDHPHIHMVINRIDNDGRRISDQNEKLRSTKVCMELTKKYGLYIASGKENVKRERLKGNDKTKYEIYDALKKAIPQSLTWGQLQATLKQSGIGLEFKMNGNTDKIQGIIFEKDGNRISGSHVDRECSFSKIDRQIKDNAYQALQVAEKQEFKTSETGGVMDALDSLIGQLSIFSLFNSPHYDATLAEYIQALKARKLAAKSKIRIRRVLH